MSNAAAAKKETKLGIDAKKSEDMASWYTQVREDHHEGVVQIFNTILL